MASGWEKVFAEELAAWLDPIVHTDGDSEQILNLFAAAGWYIDRLPVGNQGTLRDAVADLSLHGKSFFELLAAPPARLEEFLKSVSLQLIPIVAGVANLANSLPGNLPADTSDLPADLLNWLFINWLRSRHPVGFEALWLLGVLRQLQAEPEELNGVVYRVKDAVPKLVPAALISLVVKPQDVLKETYWPHGFDDGGAGAAAVAIRLLKLLDVLGLLPNRYSVESGEGLDLENEPPPPPQTTAKFARQITLSDGETAEAGVMLELVPENAGGLGVVATPYGEVEFDFAAGAFQAALKGTLAENPIRIVPAGITQENGARPNFGATLTLATGTSTSPAVHLGDQGGLELTLETITFSVGVALPPGKPRAVLGLDLKSFLYSIKVGEGDGFLKAILPADGITGNASLGLEWSTDGGVSIRGGGGLSIALPAHIELGPIEIQQLVVSATPTGKEFPVELSATIAAKLGPMAAVIERMGVAVHLSFPEGGGNLGPLDVQLGFKPPNGVGLSVDAGVIKGGGYLSFDFDKEEYAGALDLVFSNFINLKAIGLITTKMPDGSKGFSLLLILYAEVGAGIQLGYGFKLIGVGGLLGLNRTVLIEPLAEGVRTGAVNNIMFPQDIVANAPRIISDLRTIFPPELNKFLIGPMAKLGWGTPTLISLSLGIIIEIPGNIAILGVLNLVLPDRDKALVVIQVNFVGAIEFDKKRVFFFAEMFESRVLFITLEGGMGVLAAFGDEPNFVVTVGGFNPQFNPPRLPFPNPRRIALSILNESWGRIRIEAYFATTSNTAQFGARAELYFGFPALSVEGYFGFDALFRFVPFHFIVNVAAAVCLKVFGVGAISIDLEVSLEGFTPNRVRGHATVHILCFEVHANIDQTWGEVVETILSMIGVLPLLIEELKKPENWIATIPPNNALLVSLLKLPDEPGVLVLHPLGSLRISQRAVPLDVKLDKVGNQKPSDATRLLVRETEGSFAKKGDAREQFAPAQYQDMTDAEKLSQPAFEALHGGLEMSVQGTELHCSQVVNRVVRYDQIVLDTNYKRVVNRLIHCVEGLFLHFLKGNATTKSTLSKHYKSQRQPFEQKIHVKPDRYAVVYMRNNRAVRPDAASFTSEAEAREFLRTQAALDPKNAATMHVISTYELKAA